MDATADPVPPASDGTGSGRLVLVATPIGNLGDLSRRAAQTLEEADLIAAEDTRRTRVLLDAIGVRRPMTSYHEHNEQQRGAGLLDRVAAGEVVALVSDAGTPGLADPGFRLVREAIDRGLTVEAVPGPSAALHALLLSGLAMDRFVFEGFLPRKAGPRRRRLEELAGDPRTLIFYVAPHRADDDLAAMAEVLGDREAAVARELTKLHEEILRAPLSQLAAQASAQRLRGEVTVVVAGAPETTEEVAAGDLALRVRELVSTGVTRKEAIATVASVIGLPKREVYQAVIDAGGADTG